MTYALRTGPLRWHDCPGCKQTTLYNGMRCKRTGCGHVILPPPDRGYDHKAFKVARSRRKRA